MGILMISMASKKSTSNTGLGLLLGQFDDLKTLTILLNEAFSKMEYRLEPMADEKNMYLFVEDPLEEDEYECGIVMERDGKAYALSTDVQDLILGAYMRFKEERGK
ncbi:MAG: hypothetical protein WC897_04270 [Candidatus Gracilibacteria bacterium]